jgi:hypothetical protein
LNGVKASLLLYHGVENVMTKQDKRKQNINVKELINDNYMSTYEKEMIMLINTDSVHKMRYLKVLIYTYIKNIGTEHAPINSRYMARMKNDNTVKCRNNFIRN